MGSRAPHASVYIVCFRLGLWILLCYSAAAQEIGGASQEIPPF